MNVLILGGTTFFGKEIVRQFSAAGHNIAVFTRGNRIPDDMPAFHFIQGDRDKPEDLQRAADMERWDVVIDNIAFTGAHVRAALKAFATTQHYILCSSVSVYRFIPERFPMPMREDMVSYDYKPPKEDPNDPHWKYARGKLEAERECVKQRKVPWTIVRPPVVYGPEDPTERGFWYLLRLVRGGPLFIADGGAQSFRLIDSRDTGRAFLQVAENRKKTLRKSYFIGQQEIITLRDFIEESAHALGLVPDFMNIPLDALGDLAGPYDKMINIIPDITAAKKDFGFQPTPWAEFATHTAHWFRDHWKGDESKILANREKELAFATQWRHTLATLPKN